MTMILSEKAARGQSLAHSAAHTLVFGIAIQIAMLVPSSVAWFFETRLVNDINVWDKPIKFELSLIMLFATILMLLPLLNEAQRAARSIRLSALVLAFAGMGEIFYIVIQSARGRASHFNLETPLENAMYGLMGLGAVSLVIASFVVGLAIWRSGAKPTGEGLRMGAAIGLTAGAILTLITAGIMSSGTVIAPGHWVNGPHSDANGLFLLGWVTTGGDLRVPHFFATHLMQALPILGLVADRMAPASAKTIVWAGLVFGIAVVIATFVQAMMGYPFIG